MATTLNTYIQGETGTWGTKLTEDLGKLRDVADPALAAHGGFHKIRYNSGTASWPAVPAGLAAGTLIFYDSAHDITAPTPPLTTAGFEWLRRIS